MTTTVDLRRTLPELYRAGAEPVFVEVPELPFLMIDGRGDPESSAGYAAALHGLYAVAYGVRFALKRQQPGGVDSPVLPLEGLWWASDMSSFRGSDRSGWCWTMLIPQADAVTPELVATCTAAAREKGVGAAHQVRLERFREGRCAQVMHRGPYAEEGPTIAALHAFIAEHGCALTGKHHEIYLGDPRRARPDRLRTIIRQPVAPA